MTMANSAWILDAVRTPRGKGRPDGGLHGIHPQALFAQCLIALASRTGFEPAEVDDVIAGNGILPGITVTTSPGSRSCSPDWPETVPGMTLNRFCGSANRPSPLQLPPWAPAPRIWWSRAASNRCPAGAHRGFRPSTATTPPSGDATPQSRKVFPRTSSRPSKASPATMSTTSPPRVNAGPRRIARAASTGPSSRSPTPTARPWLEHDEHPRPGTTVERWRAAARIRPDWSRLREGEARSFDEICLDRYPHRRHRTCPSRRQLLGRGRRCGRRAVVSKDWLTSHGVTPRARIRATAAMESNRSSC